MQNTLSKILEKAAQVADDPFRFAVYHDKPVEFAHEILGVEKLTKKQEAILLAALEHRRIVIRSGHGVGKTFIMAVLVVWWLYARQGIVVTTAPTKEHVEDVLWREIRGLAKNSPVPLPGTKLQTEIRVTPEWTAVGLSTDKPAAFHGRHHPRLLVVIDEAPGVSEQVHLEASTLATGSQNCIVMIGNPTTTSGTFYKACRMPEIWHQMHISCMEHPNVTEGYEVIEGAVTREWIHEFRTKWGENHPFWFSRVLGEFPKISSKGVIPQAWVHRAMDETLRKKALDEAEKNKTPRVGGLDVARYGENLTVLTVRRGDAVEEIISWGNVSLMETAKRATEYIKEYSLKTLVIDASGIGAGVYDRMIENHQPVMAYNGGHRAFTVGTFTNRRTEMWWHLRQRFERERLWIPNNEVLEGDLIAPEYNLLGSGRIKVETKEDLLERGIKSPDYADSLVLCFAVDENPDADLEKPLERDQDPNIHWLDKPVDEYQSLKELPYGY